MGNRGTMFRINKPRHIFISWSGSASEVIAASLKEQIESIFNAERITCFMSTKDIPAGEEWYPTIKKNLEASQMGIICVTKENIRAPWIWAEMGAMCGHGIPVVPLLINCDNSILEHTPLVQYQAKVFQDRTHFESLIETIINVFDFKANYYSDKRIATINAYSKIKEDANSELKNLTQTRVFHSDYVYPKDVPVVRKNTIYVSTPMSSLSEHEYKKHRENLQSIVSQLETFQFDKIVCPIIYSKTPASFDGQKKTTKAVFSQIKEAECFLVILPHTDRSSSLVELGSAISLTKRTVIFYRDSLPFVIEKAGSTIEHVTAYKYNDVNDIIHILQREGKDIFN